MRDETAAGLRPPGARGMMGAMVHPRAGQPAQPEDLIDVDEVIAAYYDLIPDPAHPDQQVVFGTSGHRGSSLRTAFNEDHILATTQAIVDYRREQGFDGRSSSGATPTACPNRRGRARSRCSLPTTSTSRSTPRTGTPPRPR